MLYKKENVLLSKTSSNNMAFHRMLEQSKEKKSVGFAFCS